MYLDIYSLYFNNEFTETLEFLQGHHKVTTCRAPFLSLHANMLSEAMSVWRLLLPYLGEPTTVSQSDPSRQNQWISDSWGGVIPAVWQLCWCCSDRLQKVWRRSQLQLLDQANVCFPKLHVFDKLIFTRRLYGIMQIEKIWILISFLMKYTEKIEANGNKDAGKTRLFNWLGSFLRSTESAWFPSEKKKCCRWQSVYRFIHLLSLFV